MRWLTAAHHVQLPAQEDSPTLMQSRLHGAEASCAQQASSAHRGAGCAVPATGHMVEQAGARAAAALAMQQVLMEARELIRASLLQVASARDEAVSAQRVLYRLTRHLFELDIALRCCSTGALAGSGPPHAPPACVQALEAPLARCANTGTQAPGGVMTATLHCRASAGAGAFTPPQGRVVAAPLAQRLRAAAV